MKPQTKEIINIIIFFLVLGAVIFFYMAYPLSRSKNFTARPNLDEYKELADSVIPNDISVWSESGLAPDTFRVDTDGLTTVAALICSPEDSAVGTVLILHDDGQERDSIVSLAKAFLSSGYVVIAYDQRAAGRSSDEYTGEGGYESDDLSEVIAYLDLRNQLVHPVSVVGFGLGADAAILSSLTEQRIDKVAAVNPYLSTDRWLDILKAKSETLWWPFWKSATWWYYGLRSNYAAPFRTIDDIKPVRVPTMIFVEDSLMNDAEVIRIKEQSPDSLLTIFPTPIDDSGRLDRIMAFVAGH